MMYTDNEAIRNDVYSVLLNSNLPIPEDMTVEQYANKQYDMDKVCRLMSEACEKAGAHVENLDSDDFFDVLERSERTIQEVEVDFANTDAVEDGYPKVWPGVNVFNPTFTDSVDHFQDRYINGYLRYRLLVDRSVYGQVISTQSTPFDLMTNSLLDDKTAEIIAADRMPGRFFIITDKGAIEVSTLAYDDIREMFPYTSDTTIYWRHDGKAEARRITMQYVKDERKD